MPIINKVPNKKITINLQGAIGIPSTDANILLIGHRSGVLSSAMPSYAELQPKSGYPLLTAYRSYDLPSFSSGDTAISYMQALGFTANYALSKAMWGDARADGGYSLPQYDAWINGFVNYNAGIGCTYGFMIPSNISFYTNGGNYDIGVCSGNQLCRVTGGATGLFSYNNTWNQNTLSSAQKALTQEQYYLDIYNTMQNEYKNFKYLIHDDDELQKYFVVVDDGTGKLAVRKLDLSNKTDESYLTYTNFNLIALIEYAKQN